MAQNPQFAASLNGALAQATAANTGRDGSGTLYNIVTGAANGTRVDKILFKATGTTLAGMVRIYVYDGTNTRLIDEVAVAAITASGTVAAWNGPYVPLGGFLLLPATWILKFSINDATSPINAYAWGGDF